MTDTKKYNREFIYHQPEKVLFADGISLNEIRIYSIIRSFMDTTGTAYPSNNWIADKLGINRRNTINYINNLVNKGFLERVKHNGRRYLRIPSSPIVELPVKSLLVSPSDTPQCRTATPPLVSYSDTLLDQSNIISKSSGAGHAKGAGGGADFCAPPPQNYLDLFRDRDIPCPSRETDHSKKVIRRAEQLLSSLGFTIDSYLDYLTNECSQWLFEPYNGRTNDFYVILRPDNIRKASEDKFEDRLCR